MLIDEAHISMSLSTTATSCRCWTSDGRAAATSGAGAGRRLGSGAGAPAGGSGRGVPAARLGLYIVAEVCRALSYAHGRTAADGKPLGIVHRDVSPQNVLISEQGEVKLTDFGIAKAMNKRERTATGVVKGKVAFMSPEQAHGQALDARSDLFSVGTVLYL